MIDINESVMQFLLAFTVVGPLLGAAAALLPAPPGLKGKSPEQAVLRHGVTVTGVILIAAIALALGFDHDHPSTMQATTDISWIPALDVRIHLGIDGISLPLLVLTALLTFLSALYSYFKPPAGPSPKAFVALLLVLESGTLATFAVLDLVLFFLAFETVLVPMYFLIARWGGEGRAEAAWKFILYTLLGSVVMLLGLLLIGIKAGTFDMVALATDNGRSLSVSVQVIAVLAIGLGLAVKTPMWPLHSWLPDAHTAAPTVGSVLLAGCPAEDGHVRLRPHPAPRRARRLPHLRAVPRRVRRRRHRLRVPGLPRPGQKGREGRPQAPDRLLLRRPHGLRPARHRDDDPDRRQRRPVRQHRPRPHHRPAVLPGRRPEGAHRQHRPRRPRPGDRSRPLRQGPRLGGLLAFAAVASLGLPGLAGFWGEMLALFGAFDPADGLNRPAFLTFMSIGAFGTLLTAAYLLIVVRRVCMGAAPKDTPAYTDVRSYEFAAWTPLVVLTVVASTCGPRPSSG